jgi:coenzyme F420-reducing hydrogenase gamma subunit
MTKPKVAFYGAASCGGCEEAVINLDEDLLKVMDAVDIFAESDGCCGYCPMACVL